MAQKNPFIEFIQRYTGKPVLFVQEVMGAEPDPFQVELLNAIAGHERRLSVRSGHGVGKTTTLAWAMVYTLVIECAMGVKVVCTAPSSGTLFDGLMAETKAWINKLPVDVKILFDVTTEHIRMVSMPDEAFISARTSSADRPEALAGIHAARVLIIVDEASGVPQPVFDAARGSMSTTGATTVLIGNPTRNTGYFFDTHHKLQELWRTMHINSEDSPRVDRDFLKEVLAAANGDRDHNEYRIRVRGEFPLDDGHSFIPRYMVEDSTYLQFEPSPMASEVWGLDVARSGNDRTVLARRKGPVVVEVQAWGKKDLMQTTGIVKAAWDDTPEHLRPKLILVDSIGLGAGVLDRLTEMDLPAVGVNVSETGGMISRGFKQRDDLWCSMLDLLTEKALQLPRNEALVDELASPAAKEYSSDGRVRIESKADMKKRLGRSPDLADAVMLTISHAAVSASPIGSTPKTQGTSGYNKRGKLTRNLNAVV